ncbi:hypothetical protein L1987_73008 [Smallanthus sonchifolius]|uniref:Uncharacterized protein n=1 Tax=Smallanthus sonchifolius TaxID=185202 RepID=A0ACB9AW71_9ASTR|nr:hypothetical protein L1987_73008 [Smallanthus sonchifolius]
MLMDLTVRSGWARNVDYFLEWLSCMHFSGGGFCDAAIAEGLAEVLMMCPPPNGTQTLPTEVFQRHCILVAASNPYPLPMPVYRPPNKNEMWLESRLSDAETVAKSFPHSCISLSVICPKQLPKLKAIYNAGKRNPSATAPTIDFVKNPHYLILISEDFMEAHVALSPSGVTNSPSNQSSSNMEVTSVYTVSESPPTSVSLVKESLLTQRPVSVGNIPLATVKLEPGTVSPVASPQAVKTYSPLSASHKRISSSDNLQNLKPVSNIQQPLRPAGPVNVSILNTLSQARLVSHTVLAGGTTSGISSVGGNPMVIHMSNMISGSGSAPLAGTAQVAQHAGTVMDALGMSQQVHGMQSVGVNNMGTNVGLTQQTSSALQSGRPKYVKIWEAYGSSSSTESLTEDWPSTLLIDKLISQDHINNKQPIGKYEFIVFRALNQHGFLGQMQDKKLTLLLSVTDKAFRLIGMLFPGVSCVSCNPNF